MQKNPNNSNKNTQKNPKQETPTTTTKTKPNQSVQDPGERRENKNTFVYFENISLKKLLYFVGLTNSFYINETF